MSPTSFAGAISRKRARTRRIRFCGVALLLFVSVVITAGMTACGDDPTGPPPVPTVTSISATVIDPGDTVVVRGKNFKTAPKENTVRFNNPFDAAVPIAATTTSLTVIVPENAASGPVSVTVTDQPVAGVGPEVEVTRGVGDVWVFGGTNSSYVVELPFPVPNAEYLLIPFSANAGSPYTAVHSYTIKPGAAAYSPPPDYRWQPEIAALTARERFELKLREAIDEFAETGAAVAQAKPESPSRGPARFDLFNVFANPDENASTLNPGNYEQVTAELRYPGLHCLIYTDVDTLAGGNLSLEQIREFGLTFDTQIHLTNTTFFGTESDVDGNQRVIILITPVVNRLTPKGSTSFIGGFFLPVDLFAPGGGIPVGTTNQAEIFYVLASDPGGFWGPVQPDTFVAQENVKTIAHEYEHLISFSFRLLGYGVQYAQTTWLEEGMAHMAEDLNDINTSNFGRANRYLSDPGNISLEHNQAPIPQRGGIYLFLRYLGDRFGETIYKGLLQSKCVGRSCIENVTNENFYWTVDDFLATLYLSGKGITASDTYNYRSIDLADFDSVPATRLSAGDGSVTGTIFRTSGDFYLFRNTSATTSRLTMGNSTKAGLRTVIVRIR